MHPFSISSIKRGAKATKHLKKHYKTFEEIKSQGLDALIISGANVSQPSLELEPFYEQLKEVVDWSYENIHFNDMLLLGNSCCFGIQVWSKAQTCR